MKNKIIYSAVAVALLSGCTSIMQKNDFEAFDSKLAVGDYVSASEVALDHAGYDEKQERQGICCGRYKLVQH